MKGLIIKDVLFLKNNFRQFVFVIAMFGFIGVMMEDNSYLSFIIPMFIMVLCISTFNYDEFNNWDAYSITLPLERNEIVRSKYIFTLSICLVGAVGGTIISVIVGLFGQVMTLEDIAMTLLSSIAGIIACISLSYPAIYKFGVQKSRVFMFAFAFGLSGLVGLVTIVMNSLEIDFSGLLFLENYLLFIIPVIVLLVLYGSYKLSCSIYLKKEF